MSHPLRETHIQLVSLVKQTGCWTNRDNCVYDTKKTFEVLWHHLKVINSHDKSCHGAKAKTLISSFRSFEFILVVYMLDEILRRIAELSGALQTLELDVIFSRNIVKNTIRSLQVLRSDVKFEELYVECGKLARSIGARTNSLNVMGQIW